MEVTNKPLEFLKKYNKNFTEEGLHYVGEDICLLETKKLIINDHIDKIVNETLCDLYKPQKTTTCESKACRQSVDSAALEILGTVPAPKNSLCVVQSTLNKSAKKKQQQATQDLLKKIDEIKNRHAAVISKRRLLRKYFQTWKGKVKKRGEDERFKVFFEKLERSKCKTQNVKNHGRNEELNKQDVKFRNGRSKSVGFLNETNARESLQANRENKSADYVNSKNDLTLSDQKQYNCFHNNQDEFNTKENVTAKGFNKIQLCSDDTESMNDDFNKVQLYNDDTESTNYFDKVQSLNEITESTDDFKNKTVKKVKPNGLYENRYKAQQDIITKQKLKLLEQERLIEEMKHGKVCEELDFSMKESRLELEEILRKCSLKTRLKIGAVNTQENVVEESMEVKVNKAPKIVQKMEKRALERAEKRETIKERKRLIDEERKKLAEELVENKRRQDEEERRRNLDAIKERRKRELEMERVRRENKERYLSNCTKADAFYKRVLLKRSLKSFVLIREMGEENFYKAEIFIEVKLERKCLKAWREFIEDVKEQRLRKADEFYKRLLLRKCFNLFLENCIATKKNYQVAEDYNDFRLQYRAFRWLLNYTCKERMQRYKLQIKADKHYNYRILVTYFYQWKSLKAVLILEKAKEEKKKKWREKVLQILPDYRPPTIDI